MKELSIEEKAKACDEAKARMSRAFNSNRCTIGFMNEIFPELAESEDERIRGAIIDHLKDNNLTEWAAWLKKQGEQKPKWSEEDECYMGECISAIATKDGWTFEDKRKTKHWLKSLKKRMEE